MRLLPILFLLVATAVARAQPCDVEVLHAPAEVGTEISTWMRSETQCRLALRVRVVETTNGLYVTAQEPSGKLHERIVPDGKTAAVLVASWAADDGSVSEPPPVAPIVAAPGNTPPVAVAAVAVARAPDRPQYLIDVGGMYSLVEDGTSVRIGVDAVRLGPVMLGVVAGRQTTSWNTDNSEALVRTTDLQLLARGAVERTWNRVSLRAELAAGVERTSDATTAMSPSATAAMVEVTLTSGVWLTRDWRVRGGPLLASVPQANLATGYLRSGFDLRLWVGIDRRL